MADEQGTKPKGGADQSDDFHSLYANLIRLEAHPFDLLVTFGAIAHQAEQLVARWQAGVTMSWEQAKFLSLYLAIHIDVYERQNGPIEIISAVRPNFVTAAAAKLPLTELLPTALKTAEATNRYEGPPTGGIQ